MSKAAPRAVLPRNPKTKSKTKPKLKGSAALPIAADTTNNAVAALKATTADVVALALAAYEKLTGAEAQTFDEWMVVARGVKVGVVDLATAAANGKKSGKTYTYHASKWLAETGLDRISKSDRSKLLSVLNNLEGPQGINAWRASLTVDQRLSLNHPSAVWRAYDCKDRGRRWRQEQHAPDKTVVAAPTLEQTADDFQEEEDAVAWQRGIIVRAGKCIGDATLRTHWLGDAPPDDGLISKAWGVVDAWKRLAEYLQQVGDMTAEQLAAMRETDFEEWMAEARRADQLSELRGEARPEVA